MLKMISVMNIIICLLFVSGCADSPMSEDSKLEKEHEKRKQELIEKFGVMKCYSDSNTTAICENKKHFCYRINGYREGGIHCWDKNFIIH